LELPRSTSWEQPRLTVKLYRKWLFCGVQAAPSRLVREVTTLNSRSVTVSISTMTFPAGSVWRLVDAIYQS